LTANTPFYARLITSYRTPMNMAKMQGQKCLQTADEEVNNERLMLNADNTVKWSIWRLCWKRWK